MSAAIALIIANDVLVYLTLPLHARLLYVLIKPSSKKDLDMSFHMLMLNTTIANLLFALVSCLILEPSYAGVWFDFYEMMGPYFAKIDSIKGTVLGNVTCYFNLVLAMNRFSAIAFPLRHNALWCGRRLFWFCIVVWTAAFFFSIPLIIPGSTAHVIGKNVYGVRSVEFIFLGNYYVIYSMGCGFNGMALQIISLLFYIGMLVKFCDYSKTSTSSSSDIKRMARGVIRMTMASLCISMGHWLLVAFGLMIYISIWTTGAPPIPQIYFTSVLRFINAINNVLTPWVLLIAFNNIRFLIFGKSKACQARSAINVTNSSGVLTRI